MAILENIQHQFFEFKPSSKNSEYGFIPNTNKEIEESFPQIFLSDGEPWHEVNQYAFARYYDQQKDLKTVIYSFILHSICFPCRYSCFFL